MKKSICLSLAAFLVVSLWALTLSRTWAHEHHPPHHGTLVVLGEEFSHVELLSNPGTGHLTAYILDGEAENPVRISLKSLQIKFKINGKTYWIRLLPQANPLTGEKIGDTSQYDGASKNLVGIHKFEGTILDIKARGTEFKNVWFLYPEGNEGVQKPGSDGGKDASQPQ
jgi:hypothetical protein